MCKLTSFKVYVNSVMYCNRNISITITIPATTITTIRTYTQPFYGSLDFVLDNMGEPVPEETFTHSHLLWSSVIPYLLPPSTTIHGILPVRFMCLTVFFHNLSSKFSLVYLLAWHPPLHTPYISSPNPCLLFAAHAHTIATCFAVEPRLCHLIPDGTLHSKNSLFPPPVSLSEKHKP